MSRGSLFHIVTSQSCKSKGGSSDSYSKDSASSFVAGPFANGDAVKLTQAPGVTPNQKPGPLGTVAEIQLKGDGLLYAVDADGNVGTSVLCRVPPK